MTLKGEQIRTCHDKTAWLVQQLSYASELQTVRPPDSVRRETREKHF